MFAFRKLARAALLQLAGLFAAAFVGGNVAHAQQSPDCCVATGPAWVRGEDNGSTATDGRLRAIYGNIQYKFGPFGGANWVEGNVRRTDGVGGSRTLSQNIAPGAANGGTLFVSNLAVGKEYLVQVWANYPGNTHLGGNGYVRRGVGITHLGATPPAPDAPISLTVAINGGTVSVSWDRPERTETFSLVVLTHDSTTRIGNIAGGYLVDNEIAPLGRGRSLGSLVAEQTHTVRVYAVGAGGASPAAEVVFARPSFPIVTAMLSPDGRMATVSWRANGSAITGYFVSYGGAVSENTATQTVISGLEYGGVYTIGVAAVNAAGVGQTAAFVFTAAFAPPTTVQNVSVGVGDRRFVVSWDEPASWGNSQLSFYGVGIDVDSTFYTTTDTKITLTAVSGAALVAGESYRIVIVAHSQASLDSLNVFHSTRAVAVPSAPTVSAAFLVGIGGIQATVSWSAAANHSAITAYYLSYGTVAATLPASQTLTVINVALGAVYRFTLRAANAVGASAPASVLFVTPPGKPVSLSVYFAFENRGQPQTRGRVEFYPPAVGASQVTGFYLKYNGRSVNIGYTAGSTVRVDQYTQSNLTRGSTLIVTVAAKGANGSGAPAVYTTRVAGTWPDPVRNIRVLAANDQRIILTFDKPTYWGGFGPKTVSVAGRSGSHTYGFSTRLLPGSQGRIRGGGVGEYATTMTIVRTDTLPGHEFAAGRVYEIGVYTYNANPGGDFSYATYLTVTIPSPLSPPQNIRAEPGNGRIVLSWDATPAGMLADVHYYPPNFLYPAPFHIFSSVSSPVTIAGVGNFFLMQNGSAYRFRVRVIDGHGYVGALSGPVTAIAGAPATPAAQAAFSPDGTTATVFWSANNNGNAITRYFVDYGGTEAETAATQTVITELVNGATYTLGVAAANGFGRSPSRRFEFTALFKPSAPIVTARFSPDGTTASISWRASGNGSAITGYFVNFGGTTAELADRRTVITGLANGVAYTLSVAAANANGRGATAVLVFTAAFVPPAAPQKIWAHAGDRRFVVGWVEPASWGGSQLSYDLFHRRHKNRRKRLSCRDASIAAAGGGMTAFLKSEKLFYRPAGAGRLLLLAFVV